MGIYYSESKKKVYIAWDEKTKKGIEHWHGDFTPVNVFYHPKRKKEIFRVKLKGKMPKWVERFASENKFKTGEAVDDQGKKGFWLANWNAWASGEKPISAPNLEGAIHQFIKMIPEQLKSVRERASENKHIITENLKVNPDFFEDFGVYFKTDVIKGKNGTLLIGNDIFIDRENLSDEEYASALEVDGRLEKLVWELTTPVPAPESDIQDTEEEEEHLEGNLFDDEELIFLEEDLLNIEFEEELEIPDNEEAFESEELEISEGESMDFTSNDLNTDEIEEIELNDSQEIEFDEDDEAPSLIDLNQEKTKPESLNEMEKNGTIKDEVKVPFESFITTPAAPKRKRGSKKKKEDSPETMFLF